MLLVLTMKQYNGEKAIISLTTWKARINTVGLTLFSLYTQCPNFHIVLVLSEEEFPKKEAELPDSVMAFVNKNIVELLWVYKNYKSFKKVLFTMEKYKDVPIISADDDCIYICNYAEKLYDYWKTTGTQVVSYRMSKKDPTCPIGCSMLYAPTTFDKFIKSFKTYKVVNMQDDGFYKTVCKTQHLSFAALYKKFPCYFHDQIKPINGV